MIETGRVPNEDYAEYMISTAKRTVKQEDSLIRQIVYTGLSAKTPDPINLGIIAPTSEGKTYPVTETLRLFPKEMVWKIGSMSTKVLVRQKSELCDRDNNPIGQKLRDLLNVDGYGRSYPNAYLNGALADVRNSLIEPSSSTFS